ncbi:MAG: hydrogenase 2 operon protein HybA [Candidatus Krumholzibacteriia bacterium]
MSMTRRDALKAVAALGATAAAAPAAARERREAPADAVGMLYDASRCIGCKACMVACREANHVPYPDGADLYYEPRDLSANCKNIIKLNKGETAWSYIKRQCMHCVDPGCVSACMMGSFQKREYGIVTWDPTRCVGCRYCQVACQFNVPKFQWDTPKPRIVKCEMCNHLLAEGGIPACCDVCPREAVIFGDYRELLADARARLAAEPERYHPKIYGEHDAGGTQVLYLAKAGFAFEDLGLPDLGDEPTPALSETIQHSIYKGFIAPAALYAALGVAVWRSKRAARVSQEVKS